MGPNKISEPVIFNFHNYRHFLRERIDWLKSQNRGNLQKISQASGIAPPHLSMIIKGKRNLNVKKSESLFKALYLDPTEKSYLKNLVIATDSKTQNQRVLALKRLQKYRAYKNLNPLKTEAFSYLSNWYFAAIREMSALKDFKTDATWIRSRLQHKLSVKEVQDALDFLIENEFIKTNEKGEVQKPEKRIERQTGILKAGLQKYHSDSLNYIAGRTDESHDGDRLLQAHVCAVSKDKIEEAKTIMLEAQEKIIDLFNSEECDEEVYHFGFIAMPLTKKPDSD